MTQDKAFRERVDGIADLVQRLEATADPVTRALAKELVAAVMELHAAGLERAMEILSHCGEAGISIEQSFVRDALVGSLLLLHSLHPEDLETRVKRALKDIPGVELKSIEGSAVRVVVRHASEAAAKEALLAAAPDVTEILVESPSGFVPLTALVTSQTEAHP